MSNGICASCGAALDPSGKFCPACGAPISEQAAAPATPPTAYQQPAYTAPASNQALAPVMSVGSYIGMMLLACIPLVGFILLLVWAFGSNENPNKKNYARAVLLLSVIAIVISIIFIIATGGLMAALLSGYSYY